MTENRLGRLSTVIAVMGSVFASGVAGLGCDSSNSGLRATKDAAAGVGGSIGAMGAGGASGGNTMLANTGGSLTVGVPGLDGSSAMGGVSGTGGTTMAAAPVVSDSGYVTMSAGTVVLVGFISSATAGSGSSIALTYGAQNFCASGTVAANSTYKSWANAGFSVNQDQSGASGSSSSLVLTGSTISIGYVNRGGSELEFQFYDGSNYWCYILPASATPTTTTIPFSSLNTQCWDGLGSAFTSGTAISNISLVVPGGNVSSTPFDFCFLGLTIN
jgi:hypothetical protein